MRIFSLILFLSLILKAHAFESFSYSGRLVNNNGSPVTGYAKLTFELAYSSNVGAVLCTQNIDNVSLSNGVFHVGLQFPDCNLVQIIKNTPTGQTLSIRVIDRTQTTEKNYSFQAIHSLPYAFVSQTAKQLDQMGATAGQVLNWENGAWKPKTINTEITNGSITDDMLQGNIPRSKLAVGNPGEIVVNDSTGNLSSLNGNSVRAMIGAMAFTDVPTCLDHQKLKMNPGPVFWSCLNDLTEDSSKLPLIGGTLTGPLVLAADPITGLGAATKAYVDSQVGGVKSSQWITGGSDNIYYNTANVGIGTASPDSKLSVAGDVSLTGKIIFKPNAHTVKLSANAATLEPLHFVFPPDKGSSGLALVTDGEGNLSWAAPAAADSSSIGGDLSGTVASATIKADVVDSSKIKDGSIADIDIAAGAEIDQSKIKNLNTTLAGKQDTFTVASPLAYNSGTKVLSIGVLAPGLGGTGLSVPGTSGNLLQSDGTNWISWTPNYLTSETDPSVNNLGKAVLACATSEIPKFNGTAWTCASDEGLTAEVDTLQTITDRGTTTNKFVTFSNGAEFSKIGIGTANPQSVLDIQSTTSGILIPRMSTAERDAIVSPAIGLQIYNNETNEFNFYSSTGWKALGIAGSGVQKITIGAGLTPTGDITGTGTVAVDTGVTAGKIVKVDPGDKLPVIDGSQLTNLNPANLSGPVPVSKGGTGLNSVGPSNTILGTNNSGNALEHKTLSASAPLKLTNSPGSVLLEVETVPITKGGTGLSSLTANMLYRSNDIGSGFEVFTCYAGSFVGFNHLGEPDCLTLAQLQNFINGGNAFSEAAILGTNDEFPLHLETDGTTRMTILPNGNVGIATTNPQSPLHVSGSIRAQEICDLNGGNCKDISGGWGNLPAASMVENWPDAIVCDDGLNRSIMYHDTRDNATNLEYYSKASGGHQLRFKANTGAFHDATAFTGASACSGKSISTLITEGRTFGLLGGGMDWTSINGTDIFRSGGKVGIGTATPKATLDINGLVKLKSYTSEPVNCDNDVAGSLALNTKYEPCVCNGAAWVKFSDSSVACNWTANTLIGDNTVGRKYSDNTYAVSCKAYKNSGGYQGATGDGIYWIDPDGLGGEAEFKAYCDMTTAGGGWTIHLTDTWANFLARNPSVPQCKSHVLEKNCYANNYSSANIWKMSDTQVLTRYTGSGNWVGHSWYINGGNSTHVYYCSNGNGPCVFGIGGPGNCSSSAMRSFCHN